MDMLFFDRRIDIVAYYDNELNIIREFNDIGYKYILVFDGEGEEILKKLIVLIIG